MAREISREKTEEGRNGQLESSERRRKRGERLTSRSETILGLVGESNDLGLVLELGDDDDGSEDLLLEDGVLRVDVREDGLEGREARKSASRGRETREAQLGLTGSM